MAAWRYISPINLIIGSWPRIWPATRTIWGWIDLPKLAKAVPPVELIIGGGHVTTVKEMTRTVIVYEATQEKRKQLVCERVRVVGPDGRFRYAWVQREVEVTVNVLVPVRRLERILVQVRSLRVEVSLMQDGKSFPIGQFQKKDGSDKWLLSLDDAWGENGENIGYVGHILRTRRQHGKPAQSFLDAPLPHCCPLDPTLFSTFES
jgi:hypothetical protein